MSFFPDLQPQFNALLGALEGKRVAVIGHARPDGDCIGSQVALARVLKARGLEAVCVNVDPVPRRLRFLVDGVSFCGPDQFPIDGGNASDWSAVFVDCADHKRVGAKLAAMFPIPVGCIDHHMSRGTYAEHNVIDSTAAAAAEMLAGMFFDAGLPVDAPTAQALYAGIVTDTGQFQFQSTTRRVFELTAQLMDCGADPAGAAAEIYERESFAKLELLGRFLSSFQRVCDGRVCVGTLSQASFAETGALSEDTEGLVDYARAIDGIDVGCLIEERERGVKASLRAKDAVYRMDLVAAEFGGGGHACAAGLNTSDSVDSLYPKLIKAIEKRFKAVDGAGE